MTEASHPVRWSGQQAVVALPEHIESSNASGVREQLLLAINRGAAVLIADLAGTVSCDYSAADALALVYQRALAAGTELRLVVSAGPVHRVLGFRGLGRLIPIYPTLAAAIGADAGVADSPELADRPGQPAMTVLRPPTSDRTPDAGEAQATRAEELRDSVVNGIFAAGLALQSATGAPGEAAGQGIAEALRCLDEVVREVRDHVFTEGGQTAQPGAGGPSGQAGRPGPGRQHRPGSRQQADLAANREALLRERIESVQQRVTRTAYALHLAAADTATLLEERAGLLRPPRPIDYATEVKRWRILADQARQMGERWEQL